MKLIVKNQNHKGLTVLTVGAVTAAPFLNAVAVQAAPPPHAPAWGQRANTHDNDSRNVTLRGTVTADLSGNDFTMRATNGRTYRVLTRSEPVKLSKGDTIEVRGWIENNIFVANSVKVVKNFDTNQGQNISVNGTVTTDLRGEVFEMRGTNGRNYIVVARNEPTRLSRSDLVHVQGRLDTDGKTIIASRVVLQRDGNGSVNNNNWTNGSPINFNGVVTRIGSPYRLDVRANNQNFSVNSVNQLSTRVSVGDSVRIIGNNIGNRVVRATQVQLTSDVNSGGWNKGTGTNGSAVNFPGAIQSLKYDAGVTVFVVRADNGQLHSVRYRTGARFSVGQRVRVVGKISNGVVYATSVTR